MFELLRLFIAQRTPQFHNFVEETESFESCIWVERSSERLDDDDDQTPRTEEWK